MQAYKTAFFDLALSRGILRFGEFTLKSGRVSPYFFNAGGFDDGRSMSVLADCYAQAICESGVQFDMLFGPAYKGIPLAAAIAMALHTGAGINVPYAYNRKEAKGHGEGGMLVGAPVQGSVLITDDVISAGTSVRESIGWIEQAGARPAGVAIALDRQERGKGTLSAAQEVQQTFSIPVIAIAGLDDLLNYLEGRPEDHAGSAGIDRKRIDIDAIRSYRQQYGC
jgi:orotate phosphoribosyltransferase